MEKIINIIRSKEQNSFKFCPDHNFYIAVKINQKRWGQIIRGEYSPTIDELKSIANYFEVEITELI